MRLSILCISLIIGVFGQNEEIIDEDTRKKIDEIFPMSNNNFPTDLEEVTESTNGSYTAIEQCGEGSTRGLKRCVVYSKCDPKTNTIVEEDVTYGFGQIDIRFGKKPCEDTLDVCCKINPNTPTPDPVSPTPVTPEPVTTPPIVKPSFCGIRNPKGIDFTITGNHDNEAEYGEFPWMVAILNKNYLLQGLDKPLACGGSLITPNVVLTGAHCVYRNKTFDLTVRAGEWDTQTTKERLPYQERNVNQIIFHEEFVPGILHNDVALLILDEAVNKADHIGTICLPPQNLKINSKNCFVTGWGQKDFGRKGKFQAILKKIELPTIDKRICQDALRTTRLGPKFGLHSSFMCAGGEEGKDACTGDGGSPLVCPDPSHPERYVQVGTVAWGIGCGTLNVPGVYADVAQFRNWIDQKLRRLSISMAPYTV
ncbi:phenoloxidase-activating factor 2 isoform X2 [Diabrotica virgifera virgifera]|uniref:Phenoloxidase-activating factor 2 n=1 Tax=Diabrotica virgifera virgifera TaxID=50390 RepID=A0A6P7EZD4_DIAVI|nr:phenoloxidase-activating factor 2 isoform X2 [Diabrotica virgifera virgifera]